MSFYCLAFIRENETIENILQEEFNSRKACRLLEGFYLYQ